MLTELPMTKKSRQIWSICKTALINDFELVDGGILMIVLSGSKAIFLISSWIGTILKM